MTNEEAIKFLKQLYPNGGHCWLDEQRIEAIGMAIAALEQKGAASEDLNKEIDNYCLSHGYIRETEQGYTILECAKDIARHFANWHKEQMMAKAIDVTIAIPYPRLDGGYSQLVDSKEALPLGDNIKVLVIKEDRV